MLGVLGVVAGPAAAHFGSEDPLAPVGRGDWHHRTLTVAAARAAGFSADAAEVLARPAVAVDLYLNHPFWVLCGGWPRAVGAWLGRGPLRAVHFDDLGSTAAVGRAWQRITGGTLAGLDWCRRAGDVDSARHLLGLGLHAVQDFYSHSNWIDDPARRDTTWLDRAAAGPDRAGADEAGADEAGADRAGPDLWTALVGAGTPGAARPPHGDLRLTPAAVLRVPGWLPDAVRGGLDRRAPVGRRLLPRGLRADADGINLDSRWQAGVGVANRGLADLSGPAAFELATTLARRDSDRWLALLADRLAGTAAGRDFWRRVRTDPPATSWTRAFDDPGRLPYGFLTAGEPGDGTDDGTGWFLRVEVTSRGPARPLAGTVVAGGRVARLPRVGGPRPDRRRARAAYLGPYPAPRAAVAVQLAAGRVTDLAVTAFRRAPDPVSRELAAAWTGPAHRRVTAALH